MTSLGDYLARRLARFVLSLLSLLTVIFVLFRVMPGDPTTRLLTGRFTEEQRQALRESFGLARPLHEQYVLFVVNALQGKFGRSFISQEPVIEIILPKLYNTLIVVLPGMLVIVLSAYVLGTYLGWNKGSTEDTVGSYLQLTFRAIPHFVLAMFLLTVFSYWLELTPIGRKVPIGYTPQGAVSHLLVVAHHALLPFVVFTLHFMSDAFLLTWGNIIDERNKDYVRFLRLKGLPEDRVRSHAARNSLLPLVTYLPTLILIGIGGQVLIEVVFSWPGLGELLVRSVNNRDYPVSQAAFFFIGLLAITGNLLVDLVYGVLDPRIEYGG